MMGCANDALRGDPEGLQRALDAATGGATGPKGDTGDAGAQGPAGPQGPTGAQGVKGDTGDTGAQGPAGVQGAQGNVGAQGVKGDTGDTGAQGIQGNAGAQGTPGLDGVRTGTTAFGYATGGGGTVAQSGNKSTAVTLNKLTGEVTLQATSIAAAGSATFALNNSQLVAGDQLNCTHHATGTFGAYTINGRVTGAGVASIVVRNNTAGALAEAIVIKFTIVRAPPN